MTAEQSLVKIFEPGGVEIAHGLIAVSMTPVDSEAPGRIFIYEGTATSPVFDAPLDTLYVWVGLGAVSLAVAGTVLAFPTGSPAGARAVADAVDSVAASEYDAREAVAVPAEEIRLGPQTLGLRADGRPAHAHIEYGPVTPVRDGKLRAILDGERPAEVFADPDSFGVAIDRAQRRDSGWREAPDELRVRRVSWGEVNATLVG